MMYSVIFGLSVGVCEFLIDYLRHSVREPVSYFRDIVLVTIGMALINLLEIL